MAASVSFGTTTATLHEYVALICWAISPNIRDLPVPVASYIRVERYPEFKIKNI
jgi:hypothetical protein